MHVARMGKIMRKLLGQQPFESLKRRQRYCNLTMKFFVYIEQYWDKFERIRSTQGECEVKTTHFACSTIKELSSSILSS